MITIYKEHEFNIKITTKNLIRNLTKSRCQRTFVNSTKFLYADYPPHTVVGLPALSPTMEEGTVQGWTVEVGGEIEASDIVCQIETDKAAVDFEATDDGFMALHLVEPGHAPVPVGTPIMILVEEEEDVAAFANETASDFITEAPKEVKQEEPVAALPTPPPVTATPPSPPSPTPAQTTPPPAAVTSIEVVVMHLQNGLNKNNMNM